MTFNLDVPLISYNTTCERKAYWSNSYTNFNPFQLFLRTIAIFCYYTQEIKQLQVQYMLQYCYLTVDLGLGLKNSEHISVSNYV
jgi:hypothetical protein